MKFSSEQFYTAGEQQAPGLAVGGFAAGEVFHHRAVLFEDDSADVGGIGGAEFAGGMFLDPANGVAKAEEELLARSGFTPAAVLLVILVNHFR
jgi:hypothetical protein